MPTQQPTIDPTAFIAPGATIIGAVTLGAASSVWYGAVLRGDINRIVVGDRSNVQDGSVLHVSDDEPCVLHEDVTVGHRAVVHACEVGAGTLVGMGSIILDGAWIGPRCIVAAGTLVTKGMRVPEGCLVMGSPARVVRALTAEERAANLHLSAKYAALAARYKEMGLASGGVKNNPV